jgi:hypothetical protein
MVQGHNKTKYKELGSVVGFTEIVCIESRLSNGKN